MLRNADIRNRRRAKEKQVGGFSRRDFIGGAAATVAAFTIVPRHVLGGPGHTPPSEKLNIAGIGAGERYEWVAADGAAGGGLLRRYGGGVDSDRAFCRNGPELEADVGSA